MTIALDVSKVASIVGLSEETLLNRMVAHFIRSEMARSEAGIGRLHLEDQRFRHKYGMDLPELEAELEALEERNGDEAQVINDIPVLEAVADTRAWEHVKENLEAEGGRLYELRELLRG